MSKERLGCLLDAYESLPKRWVKKLGGASRPDFNPDFFIKLKNKNGILVVEMKSEDDLAQKNRAKLRDGAEHFELLNQKLSENGIGWTYHFYFLSPDDITEFFQAVRERRYQGWKSNLMQELS